MTPSKRDKNGEKNNYLIYLSYSVRKIAHCFLRTLLPIFSFCKLLHQLWVLPLTWWRVYQETAHKEKEGLQDSNRKFKAVEKSLWIPLLKMSLWVHFQILWKMLLKIHCLLFSNKPFNSPTYALKWSVAVQTDFLVFSRIIYYPGSAFFKYWKSRMKRFVDWVKNIGFDI